MTRQFFLNFHGIGVPHNGVDESERPYWISEEFFREIVRSVQKRPDARAIQWTFDDGNRSDLLIGASVLADHGCTASFFALTGRIDHPEYLSTADIQRLITMGMQVGLHGRDHVDWRVIQPDQLNVETVTARERLAEATGQPVDTVAIPFGSYNRHIIQHLRQCGFAKIFTSDGGPAKVGQNIVARTSIRSDMTLATVHRLIDDDVAPIRKLRRTISTKLRRYVV